MVGQQSALATDADLRRRAETVIPSGMYGHQSTALLPPEFPQFMARGHGARVWDVDGNEYVDLMCSYGPVILGHQHPKVEAAARAQLAEADCQNAPSRRMVELAEALVTTVRHADWAMFAKNGTDATTLALMIARATTGRKKILLARGAYHGAAPWCTPRLAGTTPEDRQHLRYFTYNDLKSVEAAVADAGDDLAGIIVTPIRHDLGRDLELVDLAFARGLRAICDRADAALILDDVRCGFRLHLGSSWEPHGVDPDLSAWSKAIANGYPLAAVLGNEKFREGATKLYATGSFWFSAVPMAAALATLQALRDENTIERLQSLGRLLREGLRVQAEKRGIGITQSGPPQMPFLTFVGDVDFRLANLFAAEALKHGAYLHPRHNWFVSGATTDQDLECVLAATDAAFAVIEQTLARE
jgi:glutamate-1-semialdehyde 2,1-aminomutase